MYDVEYSQIAHKEESILCTLNKKRLIFILVLENYFLLSQ